MENSVGKSGGGFEIGKKAKSLDIQSLYNSSGGGSGSGKEGRNNKGKSGAVGNGDEVRSKKKRKNRKEVSLSSFEPAGKKSKNILVDSSEGCDGAGMGLSQKINGSSGGGWSNSLLNLDGNGNDLCIPKRRRGTMGRNKFAKNPSDKPSVDRSAKINVDKNGVLLKEICKDAELLESKGNSTVEHREIQRSGSGGSRKSEPGDGKTNSKDSGKGKMQRSDVSRKSGSSRSKTKLKVEHKEIQPNNSLSKPETSEGKESSKSEQREIQQNEVSGITETKGTKISSVAEVIKLSKSSVSSRSKTKLKVEHQEIQPNDSLSKPETSVGKESSKSELREIQQNEVSGISEPKGTKISSVAEVIKLSKSSGSSRSKTKLKVEHKEIQLNDSLSKPETSVGKESSKSEQREIQQNEVSDISELKGTKISSVAEVIKLSKSSGDKDVRSKVKRKRGSDDSKVNRSEKELAPVSSSQHDRSEGAHLTVNNGDASSSKRLKNHRKRKVPTSGRESFVPSVDNGISNLDVIPGDDEENLEQNAARMLSSRFDPSCTGFSSQSITSPSSTANGLSLVTSPTLKPGNRELAAGPESESADAANRVLRPRKQLKGKGLSRKRRHFYEIVSRDLDALWFLNRRIKIFWPLDESWYYGLVNDYDSNEKLHHIKYDDRDEEWISLQNERFKLLLLPSEVPCRAKMKESAIEACPPDTKSRNLNTIDDDSSESHMESEPIISWLGRSRLKSSAYGSEKKQKKSHLPVTVLTLPSEKSEVASGNAGTSLVESETSNLCHSSTLPLESTDDRNDDKSILEGSRVKGGHLPVVYVRRHKKNASGGTSGGATSCTPVARSFQSSERDDAFLGCSCSNELIWSLNNSGVLELNVTFRESKELRFEVCVSLHSLLYNALGAENIWFIHNLILLRYGTIMRTWPTVQLEVLFVDNIVGLRFFLFEGCLKQAIAFVFLVMTVFREPDKQGKCINFQMPVTSIRFKLSCIQDIRKQRTYAYYSFSKMTDCNWSCLDTELQPHCLRFKRLSLPECTYDNIKLLEGGSRHLHTSSSSSKVLQKRAMPGVLKKSRNLNRSWPSSRPSLKQSTLPPFALSFTAAPSFFLSLHLKFLMEHSITSISLQDHSPGEDSLDVDMSEDSAGNDSISNPRIFTGPAFSELTCRKPWLDKEVGLESIGGGPKSSLNLLKYKLNVSETSTCCRDSVNSAVDVSSKSEHREGSYPDFNGMSVEIPACDQVDRDLERRNGTPQVSDLAWNLGDGIVFSPNPTTPRSLWLSNRFSPSTSSQGHLSHAWPERRTYVIPNGFGSGPRKPRTQVQYTMPFGGSDLNTKHKIHTQNGVSFKRIRKTNEKRILDGTRGSRRNLELVACDANLLITHGDKGWRECGARVFLEVTDQNEWRLAVKLCGMTKYSHKVTQDLQPGSTNRFTLAMMWKGGKDWALEFPDRSQWILFKEMHEECHNRNLRAASVKNIPIPGVRLIEEFDEYEADKPFLRSSKYFRQVETDVDMAMDPSHILYDIDSDDEEWIEKNRIFFQTQEGECEILSYELFEKTMDMFEKVSYAQQCDHFTVDEIENFEAGPSEVIKAIYEHWQQKRQRRGMALIRQLQPPSWEKYQKQVKQWEKLTGKSITAPSSGSQEKAPSVEKPPMFAFCLKPRGLEVAHKGSKHRPHKKYSLSLNNHVFYGDHDSPHSLGRRVNGFSYEDERNAFPSYSHESSDLSPPLYPSNRVFTSRDAIGHGYFSLNSDVSEWNHHPRFHGQNLKKISSLSSPTNSKMVTSFNQQRKNGKRNVVHHWNMDLPVPDHQQPEPSYGHQIERLGGPDLDEFRLRDASGAAKHALNMAKLKRERAQKLLCRADLAIHKAVSALMTAEAIKASYGDSNDDG